MKCVLAENILLFLQKDILKTLLKYVHFVAFGDTLEVNWVSKYSRYIKIKVSHAHLGLNIQHIVYTESLHARTGFNYLVGKLWNINYANVGSTMPESNCNLISCVLICSPLYEPYVSDTR